MVLSVTYTFCEGLNQMPMSSGSVTSADSQHDIIFQDKHFYEV